MSNSRNTKKQRDIWSNPYATSLAKTVATSASIAVTLYPLELLRTRKQVVGISTASAAVLANYRLFFGGFMRANQASFMKNSALAQKETVHGKMHESFGEQEPTMGPSYLSPRRYIATFASAGVIGALDVGLTQYPANMKVLREAGLSFKPTWGQVPTIAYLGMPVRYTRSVTNAAFCIGATSIFAPQVHRFLPQEQYGHTGLMASTVLAGSFSGLITNALEVLWKNTLHLTVKPGNRQALKQPSMRSVASSIYAKHGYRGFTVGAVNAAFCSMLAYGVIHTVDYKFAQFEASKSSATVPSNNTQPAQPVHVTTQTTATFFQKRLDAARQEVAKQSEAPKSETPRKRNR